MLLVFHSCSLDSQHFSSFFKSMKFCSVCKNGTENKNNYEQSKGDMHKTGSSILKQYDCAIFIVFYWDVTAVLK